MITADENEGVMVSYSKLRSIALVSLFRFQGGEVPLYAEKNFETKFTCTIDQSIVHISNNLDLSQILTKVAEENLMDDNDGVIIDIFCTFTNHWKIVDDFKMKIIRKQASATANNVIRKLTEWIHKASTVFYKPVECSEDLDYVVLGTLENTKVHEEKIIGNDWASRMAHFLMPPKVMNQPIILVSKSEGEHKIHLVGQGLTSAFDSATFFANEIMTEIWCRNGELMSQITDHYNRHSKKEVVTEDTINSKSEISVEDTVDLDKNIDILFQPFDENAPDEWKVFFTNQVDPDTVFVSHPMEPDILDNIYVGAANLDDVLSMSSEESYLQDDQIKMDDDSFSENNCDNWELL